MKNELKRTKSGSHTFLRLRGVVNPPDECTTSQNNESNNASRSSGSEVYTISSSSMATLIHEFVTMAAGLEGCALMDASAKIIRDTSVVTRTSERVSLTHLM